MGQVVEFRPPTSAPAVEEAPVKRVTMDDGYTRIAHGIVEELMQAKYKLSGREYAVLLVVIRKTYGYRKSADWVALSQFVECTGLDKSSCQKVIKGLAERKIINRKVQGHDQKVSINTEVSDWLAERPSKPAETAKRQARKKALSNPTTNRANPTTIKANPTTNRDNPTPTKEKNINNNILKDNVPTHVETRPIEKTIETVDQENHFADQNTMVSQSDQPTDQPKAKTRKSTHKFSDEDMAFAVFMLQQVENVNGKQSKANLANWASVIRLMREQDKHTPQEIAQLFQFANTHPVQYSSSGRPFTWSANIRSPQALRDKWDVLNAQFRLQQRTQSGNHHENNGSAGQQHRSQQEYINNLDWMDGL